MLPWTIFIMSWTVFHRETRALEEEAEERLEKEELRLHSLSPIPGTNILSRDSGKKTFCEISSRGKVKFAVKIVRTRNILDGDGHKNFILCKSYILED